MSTTDRAGDGLDLRDDLELALRMAAAADELALSRFRAQDLVIEAKPDATPVTDADRAVERLVRDQLAGARPGDAILGEEFGGERRLPGRQWIVDPIDGTKNFLRGVPIWGTMLALALDGVPVLGVVSAPALGRRWWGGRGLAAWAVDTRSAAAAAPTELRVSAVGSLADASLSHGSLQTFRAAGRSDLLLDVADRVWRTRSYGDVWQYMLLAEGLLDAVIELDLQPHDIAAHIPIVEAAGGRFTSFDGEPGPWSGTALASNGRVHDELLAAIAVSS